MPRYHTFSDGPPVQFTHEEEAARDAEEAVESSLVQQQELKRVEEAVQAMIDAQARAWGYDDIRSAVSYVDDDDPVFAAEGRALKSWRSAVWRYVRTAAALDPLPTPEAFFSNIPQPPQRPTGA